MTREVEREFHKMGHDGKKDGTNGGLVSDQRNWIMKQLLSLLSCEKTGRGHIQLLLPCHLA